MYLTGLCTRRQWPQPTFSTYPTPQNGKGWHCVVRVNNREYSTDVAYATEPLARNAAATRAYMICRNFSVNDGMYPGLRPGEVPNGLEGVGSPQGRRVAIGTGRKQARQQADDSDETSAPQTPYNTADFALEDSSSESGRSSASAFDGGGDSPRSIDSGIGRGPMTERKGKGKALTAHRTQRGMDRGCKEDRVILPLCSCRRAEIRLYERCGYCLQEVGLV